MQHELIPARFELTHKLNAHFDKIRSFKRRRDFDCSHLAAELQPEIEQVLNGLEWSNEIASPPSKGQLRIGHWNVERGKQLDGIIAFLKRHSALSEVDVLLLSETDIGMGRSGNRNVPREIARALGMNYVFANAFLSFGKGDESEQNHTLDNTLAFHGIAVLSRLKIENARTVRLPKVKEVFHSLEKRLGQRRALIAQICVNDRLCDFAVTHLDVHSSPEQRAAQLGVLLDDLARSTAQIKVLGGDFNCSTYDLKSKWRLLKNLWYKFRHLGFRNTIEHYMTPELHFEKPLFDALGTHHFDFKSFNDQSKGTLYYDVKDPIVMKKTAKFAPAWALRWLDRRLEAWQGCVPLRLDWLAGFGTHALAAHVVEKPRWNERALSDHNPIWVDIAT